MKINNCIYCSQKLIETSYFKVLQLICTNCKIAYRIDMLFVYFSFEKEKLTLNDCQGFFIEKNLATSQAWLLNFSCKEIAELRQPITPNNAAKIAYSYIKNLNFI